MYKKTWIAASAVLMLLASVSAQTAAGVSTSNANETVSTGSPGEVTTQAGATTQVDISQDTLTEKWAGFYGTVSGSLVLGDASGNNFYQWTANDFSSSKVVAVPGGDAIPSSIAAVGSPNSFLGGGFDQGTDDAASTFNNTGDVTLNDNTASGTALARTFNQDGETFFETYLAENTNDGGTDSPAYIAQGVSEQTGFDGSTQVNYQMMVGVGENSDQKKFDFYLELS